MQDQNQPIGQTSGRKVKGVQHKLALPDDGTLPPTPTVITKSASAPTVIVVPEELVGLYEAIHGIGLNGHMTWVR